MKSSHPSRRAFMKTAAAAASLGGIIPSTVLGANDRINIGLIGAGGMGTGHLKGLVERTEEDNIRVPAVCDVYQRRLSQAKDLCKGEGYLDYRKLLDRKDIDMVLIATPDHWHSKLCIDHGRDQDGCGIVPEEQNPALGCGKRANKRRVKFEG